MHFADHDILTAGDAPDVLVAMNPAALRANLGDLPKGATIIVDTHDFTARNLTKAGYAANPLEDEHASSEFAVHPVDLTGMTVEAVKEFGLSRKDAARAKNMFALGLLSWMYGRPTESTIAFLQKRFAKVPDIRDANITAFKRRAGTSARPPRPSWCPTRSSRRRCRRAPTATSPATWRWPTAWSPAACSRGCRCSSAPTRSRRPPTSSTS